MHSTPGNPQLACPSRRVYHIVVGSPARAVVRPYFVPGPRRGTATLPYYVKNSHNHLSLKVQPVESVAHQVVFLGAVSGSAEWPVPNELYT